MSSLIRWKPLRSTQRLGPVTDIEDLFQSLVPRTSLRDLEPAPEIRINVNEDEQAYVVSAEIPGVRREDIEVSVAGGQVTIQAEVKREESRESGKEIHRERYLGKSYRALTLPLEIESDKSQARYDNGVLTLTLPKKSDGQSTRVSID